MGVSFLQRFMIPIDFVSCRGKTCTVDGRCAECAEWSIERCSDVAAYAAKLLAQLEKKRERKVKSFGRERHGSHLRSPSSSQKV